MLINVGLIFVARVHPVQPTAGSHFPALTIGAATLISGTASLRKMLVAWDECAAEIEAEV
jgi:hypothetical protein